jgi:uncharacterized membrane protein YoaK (UPF0700 family)
MPDPHAAHSPSERRLISAAAGITAGVFLVLFVVCSRLGGIPRDVLSPALLYLTVTPALVAIHIALLPRRLFPERHYNETLAAAVGMISGIWFCYAELSARAGVSLAAWIGLVTVVATIRRLRRPGPDPTLGSWAITFRSLLSMAVGFACGYLLVAGVRALM